MKKEVNPVRNQKTKVVHHHLHLKTDDNKYIQAETLYKVPCLHTIIKLRTI